MLYMWFFVISMSWSLREFYSHRNTGNEDQLMLSYWNVKSEMYYRIHLPLDVLLYIFLLFIGEGKTKIKTKFVKGILLREVTLVLFVYFFVYY